MSTPSERIWAARHAEAGEGVRTHLPARASRPETLRAVSERIQDGVALRPAVADFLDDLRWARDRNDVRRRITDAPATVDEHVDAYLGALAEHVAARNDLPVPPWAVGRDRFLDHFWWPSTTKALRARAVVESPAAFRRRGIFIGSTTLVRV